MSSDLEPRRSIPARASAPDEGRGSAFAGDLPLELVLQGLLESLSEGLIVFDRHLRYVLWNPFMEQLSGVPADQVIGRQPADLFPHVAEQGIDALLERALAGETVESGDVPYRVPSTGRAGWVVGRYFPYRSRDGQIVGVVCLISDITDRKRAEEALAASERDLALHNAVADVFLTTPDDQVYERVLRVVTEALDSPVGLFGFINEAGDLVVPSMTGDVLEPCEAEDSPIVFRRETWAGGWGEALIERRPVLANRPGTVPPGHIPATRSMFIPVLDRDQPIGLLAVANREDDYTEEELRDLQGIASHIGPILHARLTRDRLERERDAFNRALESSNARYRAIVQQQTEFVARFLPDGTLTFVNQALSNYADATREQLIGRSLWEFLSDEERLKVEDHLLALTRQEPIGSTDISWVAPDGTTRWVSFVNHALFDEDGRVLEYQSVGRDVTERHEHEVELERAVAEREVLLREIHHRVKNNMAVISSLLSLHERDIADPATREVFQAMRRRIKSMSLVHEQLYRSGDLEHIDLGSYVDQVSRSLVHSQDDASGRIRVEREIASVTLDLESAIPCGLILTELLSNALKHAFPEGRSGTVRVNLSRTDTGEAELAVEDDGVGRAPDDRGGFGLHMVELLVRQLGGSMAFDVRGGRSVRVRFPLGSK
jgi:PAS domain S-box-containing protein